MIRVEIPNNFTNERKYIVETILETFLEQTIEININKDSKDYKLILPNENTLVIQDRFFSVVPNNYIQKKMLPYKAMFVKNSFTSENDIPIIFGNDSLQMNSNEIVCGIDIFASSFFMLTRWEEMLPLHLDKHQRYQATESLAYRFNFLHRPVVNEYAEMLWNMLVYLGFDGKRNRHFKFIPTHDIDAHLHWKSPFSWIKTSAGDLLKRRSLKLFIKNTKNYLLTSINKKHDYYNVYDYFMTQSEKYHFTSFFFFIAGGETAYEKYYKISNRFVKQTIQDIEKRKHRVGLHPSYNSYNQQPVWTQEYKSLAEILQKPVLFTRQHFLRFAIPDTLHIINNHAHILWDSSLGYAEMEGFRCGTCTPFKIFDVTSGKVLNFYEKPISVMERTLVSYRKMNPTQTLQKTKDIIDIVAKYRGEFVLLWHNSSLRTPEWEEFPAVYEEILKYAHKKTKNKKSTKDIVI